MKRNMSIVVLVFMVIFMIPFSINGDQETIVTVVHQMYENVNRFDRELNIVDDFKYEISVNDVPYVGQVRKSDGTLISIIDGAFTLHSSDRFHILNVKRGDQLQVKIVENYVNILGDDHERYLNRGNFLSENTIRIEGNDTITFKRQPNLIEIDIEMELHWIGGYGPRPITELQLMRTFPDGKDVAVNDSFALKDGETRAPKLDRIRFQNQFGDLLDNWTSQLTIHDDYRLVLDGIKAYNIYQIPITVEKVWVGAPDNRPDVEIQLLRNGEPYLEPVILPDGVSSFTWESLDQNDMDNIPYVYSVEELTIHEDYSVKIDGFTITNTFIEKEETLPGEGDISEEYPDPIEPDLGTSEDNDPEVEDLEENDSEPENGVQPPFEADDSQDDDLSDSNLNPDVEIKNVLPSTGQTSGLGVGALVLVIGYLVNKYSIIRESDT